MDSNNQPIQDNQFPQAPASMHQPVPQHSEKKVGPIVASLIVVLVLIMATLYIFATKIGQPAIPDDTMVNENSSMPASSNSSVKPVTSTSTDVDSLQSDLDNSTAGLDNSRF